MWLLDKVSGETFQGIEVDGVLYVDVAEMYRIMKFDKLDLVKCPVQSSPWGDLFAVSRCLPDAPIFSAVAYTHGGLMVEERWFAEHCSPEFLPSPPELYCDSKSGISFWCFEEDDEWKTLVKGYPPLAKVFPLENSLGIPF